MAEITPRRIMFEDLRGFAGLDYHDACCLLLSVRPVAGGMSPRESLEVMHRSSIMRNYVDIVPSKTNPSHFGDLQNASLNVMARLAARHRALKSPITIAGRRLMLWLMHSMRGD